MELVRSIILAVQDSDGFPTVSEMISTGESDRSRSFLDRPIAPTGHLSRSEGTAVRNPAKRG